MSIAATPTQHTERINALDFLRGIAVLGILVINIESFALPDSFNPYLFGFSSDTDTHVRFWVYFLFQGKFFSIFALLFGTGFYIFLERLQQKTQGLASVDLYARRMGVLFLFGVFHAYVLWNGDILYHYAVCGLLLLPLRSLSIKQLIAAVFLLCAIIAYSSYSHTAAAQQRYQAYQQAQQIPAAQRSDEQQKSIKNWEKSIQKRDPATFQNTIDARLGGFISNLEENAKHTKVHTGTVYYRVILFRTLLMMALGIILYRCGIFRDYRLLPFYWPITLGVLSAALIFNYQRYTQWTYAYDMPVTSQWQALTDTFTKESLGLAYVLLLNGLYQRFGQGPISNALAKVGRMALSNYIFQSVVCAFIFYGFGGALFNQLSRSELLLPIVCIWVVQIALSHLWLSYYSRGPLEWLWRKMTYSAQ